MMMVAAAALVSPLGALAQPNASPRHLSASGICQFYVEMKILQPKMKILKQK